ncbi:LysR family transcriptional regulator [Pigmentiphaga sp.]|uniref:LysR family transcriptional regulator n=1 Tax=Pigmentiphaga sp. TaxID=1977564 RepID=UPI0012BF54E4|nr:LysR family transcriptional regulator [Pigmentiphaga sp.]MPS28665.1 LysR family transcriptional regulator [Alcaligenaceae bacterium SAGV5]MPS52410.1 LysR family transcriptional regulator [Alcaligenaceae bacterium SAGV3]MPT58119.1 LysR family transcriptional regulator [Alcaligenaceae bacterium]
MDKFQAMQVFTRVVEANSFTMAADNLGLPRATVSTTIRNLERALQVRLLNRTTRKISLTPDGASYYERCIRLLADLEEAETSFRDVARRPRGRLRIDTPASIGRSILIPSLCEFHERYPDIELVIGMGDRPVDLVQEAVDCAIRVGELQDSSMVARRIGTFESLTCAAPSYLEAYGEPRTIKDLERHHAVHYFSARTGRTIDWDFVVDGVATEVKVKSIVAVNDSDAYVACGLQGFGLIQPARYMVRPHLESGQLREVLTGWKPSPMPISVVYLHNRHLSPKVRAFVDWVTELFGRCPLLGGECHAGEMPQECEFACEPTGHTVRSVIEQHNLAESVF